MNSNKLLEAVNKAPRIPFCDMKTFTKAIKKKRSGVYALFKNGNIIYWGETSNLKERLRDHIKGSSSASTLTNRLRMRYCFSITQEDKDKNKNSNLRDEDIEASKYKEFMKDTQFIVIECDIKELLEDVNQKPEDFLHTYFKGPHLLNNPKSK